MSTSLEQAPWYLEEVLRSMKFRVPMSILSGALMNEPSEKTS
jgi:hypothetical protein